MKINDYHLTYCSNIHAGEAWEEVFESLKLHAIPLKQQLSPDAPFGLGLRLSNEAAETLLTGTHIDGFKEWMDDHGFYVFTFNGFPYGSFHRSVVKDNVYKPDWRTSERVEYTLRLCTILSRWLPEGMEGGISTSPLSYKPWLKNKRAYEEAFSMSTWNLVDVTEYLVELHERKGQLIHIDIEPEPDCLIENMQETVDYFTSWLIPHGAKRLARRLDMSLEKAEEAIRNHIRLCYDTCHFAVEYEAAQDVLDRMKAAGIKIGKVQISAAVKVALPASTNDRICIADRLQEFAESTYLHQVVERRTDGSLIHFNDLPEALPCIHEPTAEEWRIHFHVPIFVDDFNEIRSTRSDISDALTGLKQDPTVCNHLEIETYTWEVLPEGLKQDMTTSIRREYEWVLGEMKGTE